MRRQPSTRARAPLAAPLWLFVLHLGFAESAVSSFTGGCYASSAVFQSTHWECDCAAGYLVGFQFVQGNCGAGFLQCSSRCDTDVFDGNSPTTRKSTCETATTMADMVVFSADAANYALKEWIWTTCNSDTKFSYDYSIGEPKAWYGYSQNEKFDGTSPCYTIGSTSTTVAGYANFDISCPKDHVLSKIQLAACADANDFQMKYSCITPRQPSGPAPPPPTSVPSSVAPQTAVPATAAPATAAPATTAPATPAPATTAPATTAPATTAPATSAPATAAPASSAPATPAPATSAPATSAPATTAPATTAPATSAPATTAPATSAPATTAPATTAPTTSAPATSAPATAAPASSAPATTAPATTAPATSAPATTAPATLAPATSATSATTAPTTSAPATTAPATSAPASSAPATTAPTTSVPATTAPATAAPASSAPATTAPATTAPATTAPATSAPATTVPATTAPTTSVPATSAPATSAPATAAPASSEPATTAPATTSPATSAPATTAPVTAAPVTALPATAAPVSTAPATAAPRTAAPTTAIPATAAPASTSPATVAPVTTAPTTVAPPATIAPTTTSPLTSAAPATVAPTTAAPPATIAPTTASPLTTAAPATVAPTTAAPPATIAPTTASPLTTAAPATVAPSTATATAAPSATAAPATAVPPTTAPSPGQTEGPVSDSPSTQSPVSSVVENEVDGTLRTVPKSVTDTATVGSFVSLAAAGMAATSMTTLAMVSMDCRVDGDYELPLVLHPLRFRVEGSHALGCVIGNTALMVGFYWITYLIYRAALAARPLFSESLPLDVRGFVRFPSSALFIVIWLYQGTALGGMLLLLNAPSTWAWFLGCGVSALCILVPIWVFRRVVEGTQYRARFRYDGVIVHRWLVFVIGPGEWVSTSPEKHWVLRYSSMVLTYRQDTAWWALLEFLGAFTLAVITATPTSNHIQCGHAKLASALVFCMLLLLELRYAPHVRQRDNLIDPAMLLCEAVALIFAAITLYENDPNHWTTLTTQILLYTATCFLVIKALLDVFTEICLLRTERRDRLQNDEWGVGPKAAKSDSSDPLAARTPSHASHMEDTMQHVSMKHFQTEDAPFADTGGTLSTVKTSFRIPSSDTMSTSVRNGKPFGLNSLKKEDPCQFSPVERARGTPVSANRSLGSSGAANLYVMTSGISPTSDALNPLASPLSEYTPPVTPNNQSHTSLRSVYPNTSSHDVSVRDALLQASQQPRWQAVRSAARNPAMFPLASGSRTARDVLSSAGSPPASPATRFPGLARANLRQGSTSDAHRMVAVAGTPSPPGHPNQHTSTSTVHFPRRYSMGARSPSTLSSTSDSPRRRHSGVGSSATPGSVQLPPSTAHFPDRRHSITARPPNHFPQLHRVPVATPIDTSLAAARKPYDGPSLATPIDTSLAERKTFDGSIATPIDASLAERKTFDGSIATPIDTSLAASEEPFDGPSSAGRC